MRTINIDRMTSGFVLSIAALGIYVLIGCNSQTATGGSGSSGISSIASLPKATGTVSGSSSLGDGSLAATTGTKLKDVDDSATWSGGGKSRPMCELATMTREVLREASSTDKTLCYIGKMQTLSKFTGTIDDGTYKYYSISFNGTPSMKVKFKIVKNGSGAITNYEMFTCESSDSGVSYSQHEYLSQTLTSTTAAITAKYVGSSSSGGTTYSYGSLTEVSGAIESSGGWSTKTFDASRTFSYDGAGAADGSFNQKLTITQGSSSMTINGYNSATFYNSGKAGGAGNSTFSMRMYGKTQILDASSLQTLAFGDGTAKAIMTFDGSDVSGAGAGVAATAHWSGDTRATAGTSDYAAAVASATPRADDGTVTISFTGDQTWDCSNSSFSTANVSNDEMATIQTCDTAFGFGSGENGGSNACYAMP